MASHDRLTWCCLLSIGVFIYGSHSVLLSLCKEDGRIPFHSTSVVVMIEAAKLVLSLVMYFAGCGQSRAHPSGQWSLVNSLIYAVPAMLYGINNNIIVHVQEYMDPASSQVLNNLKIVTTAVLYRLVIRKRLSLQQWFAVGLLALAGMCYSGVQVRQSEPGGERDAREPFVTVTGILLMLVYCTVSGTAGVYTEYILKRHARMSLHLQNIQLYLYGVSLNMLAFYSSTWKADNTQRFFEGYSLWTVAIIISQAVIGLIMSVIMKHGSNILRLFVISCSMIVNTFLSMAVFALRPTAHFWMAFGIVLLALFLYYHKRSQILLSGRIVRV